MREEFQLEVYETDNGRFPYVEWENSLSVKDRAIITARLDRIRQGNFGDCKSVKGKDAQGLHELRVHYGPGYRIYYGIIGKKIILLLCGGDKGSQVRDISKAKNYWKGYLEA